MGQLEETKSGRREKEGRVVRAGRILGNKKRDGLISDVEVKNGI